MLRVTEDNFDASLVAAAQGFTEDRNFSVDLTGLTPERGQEFEDALTDYFGPGDGEFTRVSTGDEVAAMRAKLYAISEKAEEKLIERRELVADVIAKKHSVIMWAEAVLDPARVDTAAQVASFMNVAIQEGHERIKEAEDEYQGLETEVEGAHATLDDISDKLAAQEEAEKVKDAAAALAYCGCDICKSNVAARFTPETVVGETPTKGYGDVAAEAADMITRSNSFAPTFGMGAEWNGPFPGKAPKIEFGIDLGSDAKEQAMANATAECVATGEHEVLKAEQEALRNNKKIKLAEASAGLSAALDAYKDLIPADQIITAYLSKAFDGYGGSVTDIFDKTDDILGDEAAVFALGATKKLRSLDELIKASA